MTTPIDGTVLTAANLSDLSGIRHGFFTREGGVSDGHYGSLNCGLGSGDEAGLVAENRARVTAALGLGDDRLATIYQVHSAEAVVAETPWERDARPEADAIVTTTPGLAVGVLTADCGPVLLADPDARVVAAAHAGWKGALGGIVERTVEAMERLGAKAASIRAVLGPTISGPAYEIGPEFRQRFIDDSDDNDAFFRPSPRAGHAFFDLPAYIAMRLERAGIGHLESLDHCTYGDEGRFFSYRRSTHRREPDYGRQLSAITLCEED